MAQYQFYLERMGMKEPAPFGYSVTVAGVKRTGAIWPNPVGSMGVPTGFIISPNDAFCSKLTWTPQGWVSGMEDGLKEALADYIQLWYE